MAARSILAAVAALLAVGLALVGPAVGPVAAAEDTEQQFVELDVEAPGGVPWREGERVPARITVEAIRAVSGTLTVLDDPEGGVPVTWEFDLDLAAGSRVEHPVELVTGWNGLDATAQVNVGGEVLASERFRQGGDGRNSQEHVAVIGIDDPPRRISEVGTERELSVFAVGADLRGLTGASTLVVAPSTLDGLAPSTVGAIDAWIRGGGQLVVDGPSGSLGPRYNDLATANPDRFGFGAGSVYYDQGWRDGVPLGGYVGVEGLERLTENQGLGRGAGGELAILAGLSLPGAGLVAAVLLGYALIAGPVLFVVTGRSGNQNRIWTVLPVMAVILSAGILTFGLIDRGGRSDAHITIVEVYPEGSRATTNLLVGSGIGGDRQVEVPEGWTYLGQSRSSGQRPVRLRVGRTTTEVGIDMPSGATAVVRLAGVAPSYDGLLTVDDISADGDDQVSARVTNNTDVTLEEAVAFVGNARTEIGELGPGESRVVSVAIDDGSTRTMQELLVWPRVDQRWGERGPVAVPFDRDAPTAAGAWTEWRVEQGTTASPENMVGVVAWSDDLGSPLDDGPDGRTALFARSPIPAGTVGSADFTTTSNLPTYDGEGFFEGNFFGYEEDMRVTLGPETDPDDLAVRFENNAAAVGFRIGDRWQWADLAGPGGGSGEVAIPVEAARDGEILIRALQPEWAWGTGATIRVVVDPDAEEAALADEPQLRLDGQGGFREPGFGFDAVEEIELSPLAAGGSSSFGTFIGPGGTVVLLVPADEPGLLTVTATTFPDPNLVIIDIAGPSGGAGTDGGSVSLPVDEPGFYEIVISETAGIGAELEVTVDLEAVDE